MLPEGEDLLTNVGALPRVPWSISWPYRVATCCFSSGEGHLLKNHSCCIALPLCTGDARAALAALIGVADFNTTLVELTRLWILLKDLGA
jgi:hypothetical protein